MEKNTTSGHIGTKDIHVPKLRKHLATNATGCRILRRVGDDGNSLELAVSLRNRGDEGRSFGADGGAEAHILDVTARYDVSGLRQNGCADGEPRVGGIRVSSCVYCGGEQTLPLVVRCQAPPPSLSRRCRTLMSAASIFIIEILSFCIRDNRSGI